MKRVLFVDDDPRILDGLRRGLRRHLRGWDMSFAPGGPAAMELLGERLVDVVVSDMRMPDVDGAALLQWVRDHQPGAVRVILSGHSGPESTLRAAVVAHRFLHKPCDTAVLAAVLESVGDWPCEPDAEQVRVRAGAVEALPAPAAALERLRAALEVPAPSLPQVAAVVAGDLALSAGVLHLVNAGFFGGTGASTVGEAVSVLGAPVLRGLLDSAQFVRADAHDDPAALTALSTRAAAAAELADGLAGRLSDADRQHAVLAARLRDLGVLAQRAAAATATRDGGDDGGGDGAQDEHAAARTGASLLRLWGLPEPVVEAVAGARTPYAGGPVGVREVVRAAHLLLDGALDGPARADGAGEELETLLAALAAAPWTWHLRATRLVGAG